jgi:hypothetical protein
MAEHGLSLDGNLRFGGGEITDISADRMKDNLLAIEILINNHNLIASELKRVREKYDGLLLGSANLLNRVEIALLLNGLNIFGTIIVGISINIITDASQKGKFGPCLLAVGALMVLGSSIFHLVTSIRARK